MSSTEEQEQAVAGLHRYITSRPYRPLGRLQKETDRDAPARGDVWIGRTSFPAPPDTGIRDALYEAIERLKTPSHRIMPSVPIDDVAVHMVGRRSNSAPDAPEPDIPELEKLRALESEWDGETTILFVCGGAFIFGGPADYRAISARLAKKTGARVASVKHRMAPTNPWPSQLLDVLVAYASLLYPPDGAPWKAARPEKLVLVGNSSGANLCLALVKVLLELRKDRPTQTTHQFHNRVLDIGLPAGIVISSGWLDLCDVFPSNFSQNEDIVPDLPMSLLPEYPADDVWPTKPPREHTYTWAVNLDHELVSPVGVVDWTGAPPIVVIVGGKERLTDCNMALVSQFARCGTTVHYHEYEGMVHDFAIYLSKLPQSVHYFETCVAACRAFVSDADKESLQKGSASRWLMPDCTREDLGDPKDLSKFDFEEVKRKMPELQKKRPLWTGRASNCKM